jgi:hypothetical protein
MSTAAPDRAVVKPAAQPPDLRIYAHTTLLYWWPVWALAFVMALWTYLDNYHLVLVPEGTVVEAGQATAPEGTEIVGPLVHVARSRVPGVVFVLTLLVVIIFSNVSLRGPWALFTAASAVALLLFLSWAAWWESLIHWFRTLHVYINLGGYLLIGILLLVVWLLALFVFDRRTFLVFSVGQIRLHDELGEEEKAYDVTGLVFEKRQYDWFRWLVGFGAGDMVIRTGGSHPQVVELRNVIRVGKQLGLMEERLRSKDVV